MLWREFERLTVRCFCLAQPVGLLMDPSLREPGLDRLRLVPGRFPSCGFLTASLGSIHDASGSSRA